VNNPRDTPREQDRARTAVAEWRAGNPGGTVEQMLAAIGPGFHKDYGPLLRGTWHLLAEREAQDRLDAGTSVSTDAEDPASTRAGGGQLANAAAGVNEPRPGRAGDGGAVASVPPSPSSRSDR
jgi:hypothetical protein